MSGTVDAVNEMVALCVQTTKDLQRIFDEMPGVIQENCTGMWGYRPCGSSETPSRSGSAEKSESIEKSDPVESSSFATTQGSTGSSSTSSSTGSSSTAGVPMSASSRSSTSSANRLFGTMETKIHTSVDRRQLLTTYWMESEEPVGDEEMREMEKSLL